MHEADGGQEIYLISKRIYFFFVFWLNMRKYSLFVGISVATREGNLYRKVCQIYRHNVMILPHKYYFPDHLVCLEKGMIKYLIYF